MIKSSIIKAYVVVLFVVMCNLCLTANNSSGQNVSIAATSCNTCHSEQVERAAGYTVSPDALHDPNNSDHKVALVDFTSTHTIISAASKNIELNKVILYISTL